MVRIAKFLRRLVGRGAGRDEEFHDVQSLRTAFTNRYHNFKLLLTANNKALEIMSDLERALEGAQPFGMSFVRSQSTAVLVNVFRIVKHLNELAPGKYAELFERFRIIQESINNELVYKKVQRGDKLVLPLSEVNRNMIDQVGGKMANVAEIHNSIDLPTPAGFVISALAYDHFMAHNDLQSEIDRRIQAADRERLDDLYRMSADLQHLIMSADVPSDLEDAIYKSYEDIEMQMGKDVSVSLRSSALGEDSLGASFAGQFKSLLNVSHDSLIESYKEIVASKYGLAGITYRLNRGIPDEDVAMCVGCMAMVNAVSGGVMYSCNPMNFRDRSILINSVWGLPKAVVDGSVDPDVMVLERNEPLKVSHREIKNKRLEFVCYPEEGVCRSELTGDRSDSQSITDEEAVALASMAIKLDEYYGGPQDIEWAIDDRAQIYILQCRPLQRIEIKSGAATREITRPTDDATLASGGITASAGVASGNVFIVRNGADRLKFPSGAVLVTAQSLPRWAPLLSHASAVITETGGVAGHLANVAREFGTPAIFGLAGATEIFSNGQEVTVDADDITVYSGRVESLLENRTPRKNLMEGAPIYETLKRVTSHIIPLNLLDPDSTDFTPRKCLTLHDITRFSHEKSVHEMFSFGKEHHFSERSSKQLVCHVPMQWWIINLDDGFKEDVDGKFVNLDNIVSIPMLALWEGIISVPWEGPPPVDTAGFMSVLIQATTNPALDPSMKSAYAARNYFMLSQNFCSLTSRFGFHFSTVEALVGDRAMENYISFSFKGGAADYPRRVRRAMFVGEILEKYDFRVEIKKDSCFARLEGLDKVAMEEKLRILGYMIIHTRQLDMVMSNEASVQQHKKKIIGDIDSKVLSARSPLP